MFLFSIPKQVNFKTYKKNPDKIFYGLPKEVKFCSRCTYSNQKPNSAREYKHTIDAVKKSLVIHNNICIACKINEIKKNVDWDQRKKELKILCNQYRKKNGEYDCVVPGSGGKDSFFAANVLKHEFGMHPLTVTFKPHIYTDWGKKNFDSWIASGFDNYLFSPNTKVQRLLTRISIEKLFHPFQPFMMGQMYFPPKIAANFNIKLVFYGENASEYGNNIDDNKKPKKELSYFANGNYKDIYISGISYKELITKFKISKNELNPYVPSDLKLINKNKINIQYLGYYLKWHPQESYYYSTKFGFEAAPSRTVGTYSKYSSIDDKIDDFHYYTTFIKFGIGRATYDSAQEIKNGEITREEGVNLVKKFDGEYPDRFEKEIFEYLSLPKKEYPEIEGLFQQRLMNKDYFNLLTNKFRSPHIWKYKNKKWILRNAIYY